MIFGQAIRTVAPVGYPVSIAEAKAHMGITETANDPLIARYIAAATARVEQHTGLGLLLQTWTQTFSAFSDLMLLRRRPLLAVGSPAVAATVTYLDATATIQTLGTSFYRVTGIGADRPPGGAIRLGFSQTWPTTYDDGEAVTVTYTVGYGTTSLSVPEIIRQAIFQTVADWYGWRESAVEGASINELPWSVENLLTDWRPIAVV